LLAQVKSGEEGERKGEDSSVVPFSLHIQTRGKNEKDEFCEEIKKEK
jgi:hypothetical protein